MTNKDWYKISIILIVFYIISTIAIIELLY